MADYDHLAGDQDARLLQGAQHLSAHVLARDKSQLAGQMLGCLLSLESPRRQPLLEQVKHWRVAPWLRPLSSRLTPPGGPRLRTLEGHTVW